MDQLKRTAGPQEYEESSPHPKVSASESPASQQELCILVGLAAYSETQPAFCVSGVRQTIGMIWRAKNFGAKYLPTGDHSH